jgi:putative hydrolase of the HAD superfamily
MAKLCLIFDLDDTLYAERDFAVSAFAEVGRWAAATFGISGLADDMTTRLDQGLLGQLFGAALHAQRPDHTAAELAAMVHVYRAHVPSQLHLFDDAARALTRFSARADVALGLITDGTAGVQAAKIRALGIGDRFSHAILTDTLGGEAGGARVGQPYFKPHPLAFERMQAALATAGDRLVYVGDNPAKDFQAPNRLGWLTVQVDRPDHRLTRIHRGAKPLPDGAAQHVVKSLDDLHQLVVTAT